MATLDLDKVSPATAAALQLGDSGDTITVPSGVTLTATQATVSLPATITASTEIKTNKISPGSGTAFTFGDSGDTFNIPSGATITNSGTASGFGDIVLLSTQTVTDQASVSFTSGIDNTYKEYIFKFIDINPATDGGALQFQVNVAGQSGYNETMTTSYFQANHHEDNDPAELGYASGDDQAQGTSFQSIISYISNAGDGCGVGELHLFNPASTTYVKNWNSVGQCMGAAPQSLISYGAGYINVTAAVDEIQFKMNSGNFDGTIKMYGYT